MPDIRIKDLTTTASTTAADDFFAADGTTNGTRKLSAYSPTFGGNATVGGTLTVSGTGTSTIGGDLVVATGTKGIYSQGYVTVKGQQANFLSRGQPVGWTAGLHFYTSGNDYSASIIHYPDNGNLQFYINATSSNYAASDEALRITTAKQVQVLSTTASTTTSSGALVVGNGSSGGLGVGGNASIGGTVFLGTGSDVQASRVGAGVLDVRHPSNTTSRIDVTGATSAGLGLRQSGTRDWFVSAESTELRTSCLTANSVASYESGVLVRVRDNTASNNTSSGALVVSGGAGVAGVVYSGGFFGNAVDVSSTPVTYASSGGCVMSYSGSGVGVIRPYANASGTGTSSLQLRPSGTLAVTVSASTVELAGGIDLKLGNAYTAGAPTATGYIVIKDSTGTSYKIPAVAV